MTTIRTPHSASQPISSRKASRHGRRTPAERRAPASQNSTSSANAGTNHTALHFTPSAAPSRTAANSRHHGTLPGQLNAGRPARPGRLGSNPSSIARNQRRRRASRSSTRAPNAARMKNIRKMSSSAVRDSTKCMPSNAISRPAAQPSTVDPNIRRAMRVISSTEMMPTTAAEIRQPNSSYPKIRWPSAIIHLPSGGCTTYPAVLFLSSHSTPWMSRLCASVA